MSYKILIVSDLYLVINITEFLICSDPVSKYSISA